MNGKVDSAEPSGVGGKPLQKHSCSTCARRKVKCDRHEPCTSCLKTKSHCLYSSVTPLPRRRKRPAQEDLFARLRRYEGLLRKNNIDFTRSDGWIHSGTAINDRQTVPSTSAVTKDAESDPGLETDEKGGPYGTSSLTEVCMSDCR